MKSLYNDIDGSSGFVNSGFPFPFTFQREQKSLNRGKATTVGGYQPRFTSVDNRFLDPIKSLVGTAITTIQLKEQLDKQYDFIHSIIGKDITSNSLEINNLSDELNASFEILSHDCNNIMNWLMEIGSKSEPLTNISSDLKLDGFFFIGQFIYASYVKANDYNSIAKVVDITPGKYLEKYTGPVNPLSIEKGKAINAKYIKLNMDISNKLLEVVEFITHHQLDMDITKMLDVLHSRYRLMNIDNLNKLENLLSNLDSKYKVNLTKFFFDIFINEIREAIKEVNFTKSELSKFCSVNNGNSGSAILDYAGINIEKDSIGVINDAMSEALSLIGNSISVTDLSHVMQTPLNEETTLYKNDMQGDKLMYDKDFIKDYQSKKFLLVTSRTPLEVALGNKFETYDETTRLVGEDVCLSPLEISKLIASIHIDLLIIPIMQSFTFLQCCFIGKNLVNMYDVPEGYYFNKFVFVGQNLFVKFETVTTNKNLFVDISANEINIWDRYAVDTLGYLTNIEAARLKRLYTDICNRLGNLCIMVIKRKIKIDLEIPLLVIFNLMDIMDKGILSSLTTALHVVKEENTATEFVFYKTHERFTSKVNEYLTSEVGTEQNVVKSNAEIKEVSDVMKGFKNPILPESPSADLDGDIVNGQDTVKWVRSVDNTTVDTGLYKEDETSEVPDMINEAANKLIKIKNNELVDKLNALFHKETYDYKENPVKVVLINKEYEDSGDNDVAFEILTGVNMKYVLYMTNGILPISYHLNYFANEVIIEKYIDKLKDINTSNTNENWSVVNEWLRPTFIKENIKFARLDHVIKLTDVIVSNHRIKSTYEDLYIIVRNQYFDLVNKLYSKSETKDITKLNFITPSMEIVKLDETEKELLVYFKYVDNDHYYITLSNGKHLKKKGVLEPKVASELVKFILSNYGKSIMEENKNYPMMLGLLYRLKSLFYDENPDSTLFHVLDSSSKIIELSTYESKRFIGMLSKYNVEPDKILEPYNVHYELKVRYNIHRSLYVEIPITNINTVKIIYNVKNRIAFLTFLLNGLSTNMYEDTYLNKRLAVLIMGCMNDKDITINGFTDKHIQLLMDKVMTVENSYSLTALTLNKFDLRLDKLEEVYDNIMCYN